MTSVVLDFSLEFGGSFLLGFCVGFSGVLLIGGLYRLYLRLTSLPPHEGEKP